ncbi:VOC family protein [Pseudactinotalea sp. HY160]|uniref:VOC family protein n=1 Tax=Pseudactinotalea sp. HY160 TaxID=2654490 RepID=UPI00128CF929|nr:VOC family protein [Pseudactinotalea sp. HY160]MPV51231.1 VOC family protein [Pseudactinotalea sp. HY160]
MRNPADDLLTHDELPPGYGTLNPFVAVRGPGGAPGFIRFTCDVLGARETRAARAVDADELLIHAEVRLGASTLMLCDAKPQWRFTPALLQVYVRDAGALLDRAVEHGARVITDVSDFHGGQRLARFLDPWHNVWWLFEYGPASVAPSEAPDVVPTWRPDPSAPPSYAHRTIDAALTRLGPARSAAAFGGDDERAGGDLFCNEAVAWQESTARTAHPRPE